jgi:hypothetical protein
VSVSEQIDGFERLRGGSQEDRGNGRSMNCAEFDLAILVLSKSPLIGGT